MIKLTIFPFYQDFSVYRDFPRNDVEVAKDVTVEVKTEAETKEKTADKEAIKRTTKVELFKSEAPLLSFLKPEIEYDEYDEDEYVRISEAKKTSRVSLLVRARYIYCLFIMILNFTETN